MVSAPEIYSFAGTRHAKIVNPPSAAQNKLWKMMPPPSPDQRASGLGNEDNPG